MCGSTGCWDNSAAGCWVLLCRRGQTAVIAAIEARIAEWTRLPPDHGEPIQVLRYQNGQKYDAHWVGAQLVPGCGAAAMASRSHCASWLFACSCECGVPPPPAVITWTPPRPPRRSCCRWFACLPCCLIRTGLTTRCTTRRRGRTASRLC